MLMNHECSGTLGSSMCLFFFYFGNLPKGRNDIFCPVYSTLNRTRGNPSKANDTKLADIMIIIKNFTPIASPAIAPKMLVGIN
jgi:hypothetical protein